MTDKITNNDNDKTAAELLLAARTTGRRKRELSTIARQLCISEEFLEALETGNYAKIPETVYILGFARNYAIELDLDPAMIVQKIKSEMGLLPDDDEDETDAAPAAEKKQIIKNVCANSVAAARRNWKIIAMVLGAFLIIIAGIVITNGIIKHNRRAAAAALPPIEFKQPVGKEFSNRAADSAVALQANANSVYLRIVDANGTSLFGAMLNRGDVYYAPADAVISADSNVNGLDAYMGGAPARLARRANGNVNVTLEAPAAPVVAPTPAVAE